MTGVIIGTVLLLALFGGMGWAVMYQLKKTDPKQADTSTREDIKMHKISCRIKILPIQ